MCSHNSTGDADIVDRLTDQGGEQEGEGDMNGESSMEACTPTFVNRQPAGICCQDSGNSNSGTVITQRGGDAWDVGGRFQSWGHTYIYGSFMWMYDKSNRYCKAVINQLEINNCLLKKKKKDMNRSTNFATNTGIPFKNYTI